MNDEQIGKALGALEEIDACIRICRSYERAGERCAEINPDDLRRWRMALAPFVVGYEGYDLINTANELERRHPDWTRERCLGVAARAAPNAKGDEA